jgi:hypothetical protein
MWGDEMIFNWLGKGKDKPDTEDVLTQTAKRELLTQWNNTPALSSSLSQEEKQLIIAINQKTKLWNRNNITRTKAYFDFYMNNIEIHWAFLAHMVSRNGGWNMTDLKGSHIVQLLSYEKAAVFFRFLEKANYFIFKDAFPQLLLYEASKKANKSYFHLLCFFEVSSFMGPVWRMFLKAEQDNRKLLTISLIINEQYLIEKKVMNNPYYHKKIVTSLTFGLQEKLGFTHILFPYKIKTKLNLTGLTVQQFTNVKSRINIGKRLYVLLFNSPEVIKGALLFCNETSHTGSREDYMPSLFSSQKEVKGKFYSPRLETAWEDHSHPYQLTEDWFQEPTRVIDFYTLPLNVPAGNMSHKHIWNMMKLTGFNELNSYLPKIESSN